jgi:uncharacterized delta-60 repeat protein
MDPSFGADGQVTVAASNSGPSSLAYVASTGATLVAVVGSDGTGGRASFIARLSSSGVVDSSFGNQGKAIMPGGMLATQVLDAGGGAVLVVGTPAAGTGNPGTVLARLTATGALDPAFGTGGIATSTVGAPYSTRKAVIGSDGRIFVGIMLNTGASTTEIGIAAFSATGAPDPSFGDAGIAATNLGGQVGWVGIAIQPDGKLVADAGAQLPGAIHTDAVVARFLPTGQVDTAFATNGLFVQLLGGTSDDLKSVVVEPNGNLLVAGAQFTSQSGATPQTGVIAELTSQGTLNTSFGVGGTIVESPPGDALNFVAIATGADNNIYGLLMEQDGPFNCSLRRYTPDGKPDPTFGSGGVVSLTHAIPADMVIAYQGRPELALGVDPTAATVVATRFLT